MKKVFAIAGLVICILGYSVNQGHATVIEGYFSGSYIAMPYGEGGPFEGGFTYTLIENYQISGGSNFWMNVYGETETFTGSGSSVIPHSFSSTHFALTDIYMSLSGYYVDGGQINCYDTTGTIFDGETMPTTLDLEDLTSANIILNFENESWARYSDLGGHRWYYRQLPHGSCPRTRHHAPSRYWSDRACRAEEKVQTDVKYSSHSPQREIQNVPEFAPSF